MDCIYNFSVALADECIFNTRVHEPLLLSREDWR